MSFLFYNAYKTMHIYLILYKSNDCIIIQRQRSQHADVIMNQHFWNPFAKPLKRVEVIWTDMGHVTVRDKRCNWWICSGGGLLLMIILYTKYRPNHFHQNPTESQKAASNNSLTVVSFIQFRYSRFVPRWAILNAGTITG